MRYRPMDICSPAGADEILGYRKTRNRALRYGKCAIAKANWAEAGISIRNDEFYGGVGVPVTCNSHHHATTI